MKQKNQNIRSLSTLRWSEPKTAFRAALSIRVFGKRPLPAEHRAIDVVIATLKWDPSQRIDAAKGAELTGTGPLTKVRNERHLNIQIKNKLYPIILLLI